MAAETQYTANTGLVTISTANSNLDGTGTLGTIITGGSKGTFIKRLIVKAVDTGDNSTTEGMIRIFVDDGAGNIRLLTEIYIPESGQSSTNPTFEYVEELNFKLEAGYILKASTENAETFNVIAEGLDFAYYSSSVRPDSTNYTARTGQSAGGTKNSNLDGSGTLFTVITAGASGSGWEGLVVKSIRMKAYTDISTGGMLRFFIQNTGSGSQNTFLFTEVPIFPADYTGASPTYEGNIVFGMPLQIEAGFKVMATIDIGSGSFTFIAEGMDWKYPS